MIQERGIKNFRNIRCTMEHHITIINKWRKCNTTVTSPRAGHASKFDEMTSQILTMGAAKRPVVTLKELKEYLISTVNDYSHLLM